MTWEERSANVLKREFGHRAFSTDEAYRALRRHSRVRGGYAPGSIHHLLYSLCKRGELVRFGRGLYAFPPTSPLARMRPAESVSISGGLVVDLLPGILLDATRLLKARGVEFMATGPSTLVKYHHYVARRLIHLFYTIKGSGEPAAEALRGRDIPTLVDPNLREVEFALESLPGAELFVVREYSSLDGNVGGRALLERALVDSYFETTRRRIPFPEEEVARIFANVARNEPISVTRLTRFASRRGIASEIASVIVSLGFPVGEKALVSESSAKHVARFLSHLEKGVPR
jgi:hypothetical protein